MELIPAIDVRGGKCVQLVQGDFARETVYGDDPVAMAERWAATGATRLHIVDLDGAKEGRPVNDKIIAHVVQRSRMRVQVAGGVRDDAAVDRWVAAGVDRVIVGTAAVHEPELVERAAKKYGDRVAIAVDARDGRVAVSGWVETSQLTVEAFVRDMAARGARHFIYTDISRDGTLGHPDFEQARPIVDLVAAAVPRDAGGPIPLVYSGGVTSIDDLLTLAGYGIDGAISGTALYDGRIDARVAVAALARTQK
jgi:phosphoribosylformimino-5-aminoimidazole carboxamide ribotide isomerase